MACERRRCRFPRPGVGIEGEAGAIVQAAVSTVEVERRRGRGHGRECAGRNGIAAILSDRCRPDDGLAVRSHRPEATPLVSYLRAVVRSLRCDFAGDPEQSLNTSFVRTVVESDKIGKTCNANMRVHGTEDDAMLDVGNTDLG